MVVDSRKEIRTTSNMIVDEAILILLVAELFQRIGPQQVTHEPMCWRLSESVDLLDDGVNSNLRVTLDSY